jgi:hypothetical protein
MFARDRNTSRSIKEFTTRPDRRHSARATLAWRISSHVSRVALPKHKSLLITLFPCSPLSTKYKLLRKSPHLSHTPEDLHEVTISFSFRVYKGLCSLNRSSLSRTNHTFSIKSALLGLKGEVCRFSTVLSLSFFLLALFSSSVLFICNKLWSLF